MTQNDEAIRQLRAAISRSGLSARAYARKVLIRNERTVRRWLAGDAPIPTAVRDFLAARQNANAVGEPVKMLPDG